MSTTGLTLGNHRGVINIESTDADNSPLTIVVNLDVIPRPILVVKADSITFSATVGQQVVQTRKIGITNSGSGTLSWTATSSDAWISVMPAAGTDSGTVFVGISAPADAAGTRDGFVVITALDAEGSPAKVPVRLTLNPPTFTITALSSLADGGTVTGGGSFQAGKTATVTATPAAGCEFTGWTEDGRVVSKSSTYSFLVAGNRTLVANFGTTLVAIRTSSEPTAGGTTSGGGSFTPGSSVTVVGTPSSGYRFASWKENGGVVSSRASYTFIASANRDLVAEFQIAVPTINITTSSSPSGGGTTAGAAMYSAGATVTVSASPSAGYFFVNWTQGGGVVSTSATYTFTASADRALVANFATGKFTITTSSNPPDGGSITGAGVYSPGTIVRISAIANVGYTFTHWTENGVFAASGPNYVFTVTGDRALVGNFSSASWSIEKPRNNEVVGDKLDIRAIPMSGQPIASARANVAGREVSLSNSGTWIGSLDLTGLPRSPLNLTLTATYPNGDSFSTTRTFIHDKPPLVTVTAPANFEVGRPSFHYSATCTDDDPAGCLTFRLYNAVGIVYASGTSSIDGTLRLPLSDGHETFLYFIATDAHGNTTKVERHVYIESSTRITPLVDVLGAVLDFRDGRVLYKNDSSELVIRTLASGLDETIPKQPAPILASLTPLGAIFISDNYPSNDYLYDWRNRSLTKTLGGSGYAMLEVNGRYALYGLGGSAESGMILYRRDLLTGMDVTIGREAGTTQNHVAADGSVAFWRMDYDVYWYRNGVTTRLTNDDDGVSLNRFPITDGTSVVFSRYSPSSLQWQIIMHDGATETALSPPGRFSATPATGYAINAGWIAFTTADANNVLQGWLRSPTGVLRQVSPSPMAFEALASDGTVVYRQGNRRYIAAPGESPRDVSADGGRVVWRDPDFLLLFGRTVFRIPR
jgi:hypothetical protein